MNDDEMRSLLSRSLREGGMDDDGGPDQARIAGRVRGVRRRRAAVGTVGGAAAATLVGLLVWQTGAFTNDPVPPATPTTATETPIEPETTDPTETTEPDPTTPSTDPADWSDAVFPECGDTGFELPERTSQLIIEGGPDGTLLTGTGWTTTVVNTGETDIAGVVAIYQVVLLDSSGDVVTVIDLDDEVFWGQEGHTELDLAAGASLPFTLQTASYGCDGSEIGAGEYEAYVLLTIGDGTSTDPADLEQAQGGPFPLIYSDDAPLPSDPLPVPDGAPQLSLECGDAWATPDIATGYQLSLADELPSQAVAVEEINGTATLTTTGELTGIVYNMVVLTQDGVIVGTGPGNDNVSSYYLSRSRDLDLDYQSMFLTCDSSGPLPPGEYDVSVVTVRQVGTGGDVDHYALAATDPATVTLQ